MQTQVNWHSIFNLFQKYFRPQCDETVLIAHCICLLIKGSQALCPKGSKSTHKNMVQLPEEPTFMIVNYFKNNLHVYNIDIIMEQNTIFFVLIKAQVFNAI